MSKETVVLRCPKCDWTFEAMRGDRLHPHCSTKKPKPQDVIEDIAEMKYKCRNPNCHNSITVYYYRGKPSFKLV